MKVYADNAATTKISERALEVMIPYLRNMYGNPSSLYTFGQEAKEILEKAREDIAAVLSLIRPFVKKKILLPRTQKQFEQTYNDYIVYELDGAVRACAALHIYDRTQAEIACVTVDETCSHIGIGPKMIEYLLEKAKAIHLDNVFILTTQTADWFEKFGFKPDSVETLPPERKAKWNPKRGSKLFRLKLAYRQ